MSRPFKFRAWNKLSKKMASIDALDFTLDGYRASHGKFSGSGHLADIELMQFTGLLDQHDKEIFEGDILKIEKATALVVFWERPPAFGLNFHHNEDEWCEDWNLTDDSERMEIIGNVYEHPTLLQKSDEDKGAHTRDTQFAGFAKLLFDELYVSDDIWFDATHEGWKEHWQTIIAQRTYDFAAHTATHTILTAHGDMRKIPDMTEWPEEKK